MRLAPFKRPIGIQVTGELTLALHSSGGDEYINGDQQARDRLRVLQMVSKGFGSQWFPTDLEAG